MNGQPTAVCAPPSNDHGRCCGFGADGTPCGCACHAEDYQQIRQILAADMTVQPTYVPLPEPMAVYGLVQEARRLYRLPSHSCVAMDSTEVASGAPTMSLRDERYANENHPRIRGRCPSCGAESLFLGAQGYVTCSVIGCKDPGAAHDLLAAEYRGEQRARRSGEGQEPLPQANNHQG